jgi:pilus assembly protein Flp/PilA
MRFLKLFVLERAGATAAEYALMLAIVGAALATAAMFLGDSIANSMNSSRGQIATCGGGGC